jgi:hypothetical protein
MKTECILSPLKRVRYFSGQLLTIDDFLTEQQYSLERDRRHNRCLHGYGVACGLEVSTDGTTLRVDPGLALDCLGEEIAVCVPVNSSLPRAGIAVYVGLNYVEKETDPVPVPGGQNGVQNSRLEEGFEITLTPEDPCAGHKRSGAHRLCCGTSHAISIAKLKLARGQWKIDRQFRRPRVR